MSNFQAGDVVYLKSGSPAMTVTSTNEGNWISVVWFADHQKEIESGFPTETLTKEKIIIDRY